MKARIKKFGFEVRENFTATIQIDKKLKTMKDQYTIKMGTINEEGQLFEIKGGECLQFDAYILRWEYQQNAMLLKIKVDQKVIHFLSATVARGIDELGIDLK